MIRSYRKTDWGQVSAIYDLAKPDEMRGIVAAQAITPLAQDSQMLRYFSDSEVWVYEENGSVIGFIGRKKDVVSWLFVHPDHRRKGIARSLLNKLMESWKGPLELKVTRSNQVAMRLYVNLGFEVDEEFEGSMYGRRIPAVRMRWRGKMRAEDKDSGVG